MTRYLHIGMSIAEQVRSGRLGPGAELPSVRACARQHASTVSTVGRAYRYLAERGVITQADRRRARIAPDGALAAARLLSTHGVFRLAGSDDPALQVLLGRIRPAVLPVRTRGSFRGLCALSRDDADGAAIHLRHHTGSYNAPFARALLRGRRPHLLHLWRREQGLIVPPGNPRGLAGVADLAGVRMARREAGSGTRVLLDQSLGAAGLDPEAVAGPVFHSHREVALAVAAGVADAGLGVRAAANDLDLAFVPLAWEPYELVLPGDALGAAEPLISALRDPALRAVIRDAGGYDLTDSGTLRTVGSPAG